MTIEEEMMIVMTGVSNTPLDSIYKQKPHDFGAFVL